MAYIGQGLSEGFRQSYSYIAQLNQEVFTASYVAGQVDVYVNGVHQYPTNYTATNGANVTITGLTTGDEVVIIAQNMFSVADTVSASQGGAYSNNVTFGDNVKATFGDSADLEIYHDSSNSYVKDAGTGNLILAGNNIQIMNSTASANYITGTNGGAVQLHYNGPAKLSTTNTGINVTGTVTADGVNVPDGEYLRFNTNGLTLRTNANNAYIVENSGGKLAIQASNLELSNTAGTQTYAYFSDGGSSQIFYNNDKKLETTNTGIDVTGTVVSDAIHVPGGGNIATNEAFGTDALVNNTTGDYNTAIGYQALQANIGGVWNTAVGWQSLWKNTTGSYNTAYGVGALVDNVSGYQNIGIGMAAGSALTGSYNTVIGSIPGEAGISNTVIIGAGSTERLRINSTGDILVSTGNVIPVTATQDLGTITDPWQNIYTQDLNLSNEKRVEGNSVDGTKGNWTIQEGEEHLYIINNKSGKKYRFALEEIQ